MLKIFSELLEDIEFGYLEKNDFKFAFLDMEKIFWSFQSERRILRKYRS